MTFNLHSDRCAWPHGLPCLNFSTDGTRLGAEIAHAMNLNREESIEALVRWQDERDKRERLTGMPEEQADWDKDCECNWQPGNLKWDFICSECGAGGMISDWESHESPA